jgi:hypothetical protein
MGKSELSLYEKSHCSGLHICSSLVQLSKCVEITACVVVNSIIFNTI